LFKLQYYALAVATFTLFALIPALPKVLSFLYSLFFLIKSIGKSTSFQDLKIFRLLLFNDLHSTAYMIEKFDSLHTISTQNKLFSGSKLVHSFAQIIIEVIFLSQTNAEEIQLLVLSH
jgi:hypothetical protein